MSSNVDISIAGENRGFVAGRDVKDTDLIQTGDVSGSCNAIGVGARVVITNIKQARSTIDELAKEIQLAESQLADAIQRKIVRMTGAVEKSVQIGRRNPYRSLLDYRLEDAPFFYGRDDAIKTLLGKIHDHRLTVLHADSGSGKSSLLQAGLMSRLLAAGHLPLRLRPYRQAPTPYIKQTFLTDIETLPEFERFQDMSLLGYLQSVTKYLGESTLYLFLDQFEEFFTELPRTEQEGFTQDLSDCLDDDGLNVRWVLSLRKEYLSDLSLFRPRIAPFENDYFLPTFRLEEAKDVIVEPARKHGVEYEPQELVNTIIADLHDTDGHLQPPQVQLVCHELFEDALASATPHRITTSLYEKPRGRGQRRAQGILSNHLSRVLDQMSASDRSTARQILEALISSQTRRAVVSRKALVAKIGQLEQVVPETHIKIVLGQLVNDRLLRTDEDENDEPLYELAHDYLLDEIELAPETIARKLATEILAQEIAIRDSGHSIETPISEDRLHLIERNVPASQLSAAEKRLVRFSREQIAAAAQIELNRVKAQLDAQKRLTQRTRMLLSATIVITVLLAINPTANAIRKYRAVRSVPMVNVPELGIQFEAYEVSNERYGWCVSTGECSETDYFRQAKKSGMWEQHKKEPVRGVTANQAFAFCSWVGRTLPTAAQWIEVAPSIRQWKNLTEDTALFCRKDSGCQEDSPDFVGNRDIPQYLSATNGSDTGIFDLVGSVREWTKTSVILDEKRNMYCQNVDMIENEERFAVLGNAFDQYPSEVGNYDDVSTSVASRTSNSPNIGIRCTSKDEIPTQIHSCPSFK